MATPTNRVSVSLANDLKPDRSASRRRSRSGGPEHLRHTLSLPLGIIAIVGGLVLGAMALPHIFAAIAVLQAQPTVERYISGEQGLFAADIESAAERLEFALDLAPDADTALLLADLRLWQARRATDAKTNIAFARKSVDAAKIAVRHAPAHPVAWSILADATDVLMPGDPAVAAPLARALEVAPYDPRRRNVRVELAMRHWPALPPRAQQAAGPLIVAMARNNVEALARLAKQNLGGLAAVRGSLAGDAELARRFDAAYVALPN
ncbi:MAG: hypothetical protein JO055_14520 [Alphaproteobacteria bacterium]|nr:hypothetical protein [Alphaproteobacteria bacterium]